MRLALLFLLTFPFLVVPSLDGQQRLGVVEAIEIGLKNNPALQQDRLRIEATKAARLNLLNVESPDVGYFREGIRGSGFSEQRWFFSQQWSNPLSGIQSYRASNDEIAGKKLTLRWTERRLKARIKNSYATLTHAQGLVQLANQQVELSKKLIQATQRRIQAGLATQLELTKAQLEEQTAKNALARNQAMFQNERYTLFALLGLKTTDQTYDIVFPDTLRFVEAQISQEDVLAAIEMTPLMQSANKQLEAQNKYVKAAKGSYFPNIAFQVYRQDFGDGFDFSGVELQLGIPLWFGLNQAPKVRTAHINREAMQWRKQELNLQLKQESEQAWHSFQQAREIVLRYQSTMSEQQEELLIKTQKGYELGRFDLIRLLEEQRSYLLNKSEYLDALLNYYQTAIQLEVILNQELVFNS